MIKVAEERQTGDVGAVTLDVVNGVRHAVKVLRILEQHKVARASSPNAAAALANG